MDVPKQIKSVFLVALFGLLLAPVFAGQDWQPQPIGPFGTLNNRDNSFAIPSDKAQDLLNVDLTPGGKSVRKRKGFGTAFTLQITTSAVHGNYDFFDASGNEVSLFFNDTRMAASISGASTATVLFSTGPNGATYQCTDSLGSAYCANTSRTALTKTNGSTYSSITTVSSTGTMLATCVTRLAMAGFSDRPSGIDFSADSDFTTWGTGSLGSSAVQLTVNAPGAKITHIVYAFGRLMWFKDTSFGYVLIGNQPLQTDWVIKTISFDVGTNDNTSVYREGILYFRGKDSHIYAFDGSNYQRLTREISGTINQSQTRNSNSWTQTSQSDWNAGTFAPSTTSFDTTTSVGDLSNKIYSNTQTTAADFAAGTFDFGYYADTQTNSGALQTTFPETCDTWRDGTSGTKAAWSNDSGGTVAASANGTCNFSGAVATVLIRSSSTLQSIGTAGTTYYFRPVFFNNSGAGGTAYFALWTTTGATTLGSVAPPVPAAGGSAYVWMKLTTPDAANFKISTIRYKNLSANTESTFAGTFSSLVPMGSSVTFYLSPTNFALYLNNVLISSGTHTFSSRGPFYSYFECDPNATSVSFKFDDFTVSPESFTYTSPSFDTTITSPLWAAFNSTSSGSTLSFTSQVSGDNSTFDSAQAITAGAIASNTKRYIKINSLFNLAPTSLPGSVLSLNDYTVAAYSTGTWTSTVNNASSITSWDSFVANKTNGGGTHQFYMRSATATFAQAATVPAWTAVTPGAVPTLSTGAFIQVRDDFLATSASAVMTLSDFTVNWFEGSAADKSYATYFDDRIWWAVTSGTGTTTNNRILVYDILNQGWLLYDIGSNGFYIRQNRLYFGSSTSGYIYKYGDADNDNGSAINSYWKSKDFFGGTDPFTPDELANISIAAKSVALSSMTVTYTTDGSSATSYTMSLSATNNSFIDKNKNLPAGTVAGTYNIKIGNNAADQPWEVFGIQVGLRPRTWIPTQ